MYLYKYIYLYIKDAKNNTKFINQFYSFFLSVKIYEFYFIIQL
jgi:hypothetical protein